MIAGMAPPPLTDLHLHSTASDGVLSPTELMHHVAEQGVAHVALTDHDTLDGCAEAAATAATLGLRFTTGIELSCQWQGRSLHVLGLGVRNASDPRLEAHIQGLAALRRARIEEMGARLERKARIPAKALVARLLAETPLATRLHLAKALLRDGHVTEIQQAFDRWLGQGKPAHVPEEWPALEATLAILKDCEALPVLAHAHRYRLSSGSLSRLVAHFAAQGGAGLEVSVGGMARHDLDRLATLTRRHGLAASAGSDFHDPALPWHRPGRFAKLPDDLEPIAARLP